MIHKIMAVIKRALGLLLGMLAMGHHVTATIPVQHRNTQYRGGPGHKTKGQPRRIRDKKPWRMAWVASNLFTHINTRKMLDPKKSSAFTPCDPMTFDNQFGQKSIVPGMTKFERFCLDTVSRLIAADPAMQHDNALQNGDGYEAIGEGLMERVVKAAEGVFTILDAYYEQKQEGSFNPGLIKA